MFPDGMGASILGKDVPPFSNTRAHTHSLLSRIQVKAENEKLKRQLIAPLRNSDDLARGNEGNKPQEKGAGVCATGIPKRPRIAP